MPASTRRSRRRSFILAVGLLLALAAPAYAESGFEDAGFTPAPPPPHPRDMHPGRPSGFQIPFAPGFDVRISQGWDTKGSHQKGSKYAYDFAVPMRTPVRASAPGIVTYTRTGNTKCGGKKMTRYANLVTIYHADGSATQYGHLSRVDVEVGDVVEAGDRVGLSGKTGHTDCQPHLHFARQYQGDAVTQSIPIYFKGYDKRRLFAGDVVTGAATCGGPLAAKASESDKALPTGGFCGAFFAAEFAGPAVLWHRTEVIAVDRDRSGAGGYWLDAPQPSSARWTGRFEFATWWYTFRVEATGAVRVKVDGAVVLEDWADRDVARVVEVPVRMREGVHDVVVEQFTAHRGEHIKLDWSPFLVDG